MTGAVNPEELLYAERCLIRILQAGSSHVQLRDIWSLMRLNPKLVSGLLRVYGRLSDRRLGFDLKYPGILLARRHTVGPPAQPTQAAEGHRKRPRAVDPKATVLRFKQRSNRKANDQ